MHDLDAYQTILNQIPEIKCHLNSFFIKLHLFFEKLYYIKSKNYFCENRITSFCSSSFFFKIYLSFAYYSCLRMSYFWKFSYSLSFYFYLDKINYSSFKSFTDYYLFQTTSLSWSVIFSR